jgi:hypothetical protein
VKIEAGHDIAFLCIQDVSMLLMLSVHPSRQHDLLSEHRISFSADIRSRDYLDAFGNICTRLMAPSGLFQIRNRFAIADSGKPDEGGAGGRTVGDRSPARRGADLFAIALPKADFGTLRESRPAGL